MTQGNLIYSLVLGLLSFGAYQSSIYAGGNQVSQEGKRLQRGLLILLVVQVISFITTWVAWWGWINPHIFIPVIDRVAALFSLVLILWLWALPNLKPETDKVIAAIELIILVAGGIALVFRLGESPTQAYSTSTIGIIAYTLGSILVLLGIGWLIWKRPDSANYGIAMLAIFLIGYLARYIVRQAAGDYIWSVHIGEMVGFIFLLILPRRLALQREGLIPSSQSSALQNGFTDTQLLESLAELKSEKVAQQYYLRLTRLLAQEVNAEQCLLLIPPKTGNQLIVPVGYSLPEERVLDGFTLDGRKIPSLLEAVQQGRALQVDGRLANTEAAYVSGELNLENASHLLAIPFKKDEASSPMTLLFTVNKSKPAWSQEDAVKISEFVKSLVSLAAQAEPFPGLQAMQKEAENLRRAYAQLKGQYEALKIQADAVQVDSNKTAALLESQKNLQELVRYLQGQNRELEIQASRARPSTEEVEQLREELQSALKDLARIPITISKSDQKMLELQLSAVKQLDDMGANENLRSIAQELRQPLSSIVGYTDVLLGESAGLLGAMQRKFLERIKASSERLSILANELVQVLTLENGTLEQTQSQINLQSLIDEAVGNVNAQMVEKNIAMKIDMPAEMPALQANQDVLQQIMANLLENACLVTPPDGEIKLFARVEEKSGEPNYLHLSITDQGGGIAQEDIPRIFSRRYKQENTPIRGIGDSGVGLSIVKSLVELNKGRLWVEANEGSGSTISALIPLGILPHKE